MTWNYLDSLKALRELCSLRAKEEGATMVPADLASLAAACKSASEAQKTELETHNLVAAARSEAVRFWVPIVASFLSVAILGSTLWLQTRQFKEVVEQNTRSIDQQREALNAQRDANEDTQWREALKLMADKPGQLMNDAASVALLTHFVSSAHVGAQARDFSIFILQYATDPSTFDQLFSATFRDQSADALHKTANLNRALTALLKRVQARAAKVKALADKGNRFISQAGPDGRQSPQAIEDVQEELDTRIDGVQREISMTGKRLSSMLTAGTTWAPTEFSEALFFDVDLSGRHFKGADLTGTAFIKCNVDGADFSGAKADRIDNWSGTAWWRASRMSKSLIDSLVQQYALAGQRKDFPDVDDADYEKNLQRLRAG